jgi:hypothetical protein
MPQTKFTVDGAGIRAFLAYTFNSTDCRLYEAYSLFDSPLREFKSVAELADAFELGVDPEGQGFAQHLALWSPTVMPTPNIRHIALKVPNHQYRFAAEGCGLFFLHLGGIHKGSLTASTLSYWSEAGARQRCMVTPGPDCVNWVAHKKLGGTLSRQAKRVARVP